MITSNKNYPFGGKVATVETPSFRCMVSTAKEGIFKKQSVMFTDFTSGMESRRHVAKLLYNNVLDSDARLGLHDAITHTLDEAGMPLADALRSLFDGLKAEGMGFGALLDEP